MTITIIAPIKLASGRTEAELLAASDRFQKEFASQQPGLLRRELVRGKEGDYLDIIQFRSMKDAEETMAREQDSAACHAFFAVMDMTQASDDPTEAVDIYQSLATYT